MDVAVSAASITYPFERSTRESGRDWLARVAGFVSSVEAIAAEHHGEVVGSLPAGVLLCHGAADVADAINAAIDVQERLNGHVACSIGIASGPVWATPRGTMVGEPLAAAVRLSGAAIAGGIFVDHATVQFANLGALRSTAGREERRRPVDYVIGHHYLPIGSGLALEYSEVVWGSARKGISPDVVTDLALAEVRAKDHVLTGVVRSWDRDKDRGFVRTAGGDHYYSDDRFVVGSMPAAGDTVAFVARPPVVRGRNPVAGALTVLEAEVPGVCVTVESGAFFLTSDAQGNRLVVESEPSGPGMTTARLVLGAHGEVVARR